MDGNHKLWMRTGGSAGHAGLWALDVNEGTMPNRIWEPKLMTAHEFKQEAAEAKEQQQAVEKHQKHLTLAQDVELYLAAFPEGLTATDIRDHVGVSGKVLTPVLANMLADHKIVHTAVKKKNNQIYDGYTLEMNAMPDYPDYGEPDESGKGGADLHVGSGKSIGTKSSGQPLSRCVVMVRFLLHQDKSLVPMEPLLALRFTLFIPITWWTAALRVANTI